MKTNSFPEVVEAVNKVLVNSNRCSKMNSINIL